MMVIYRPVKFEFDWQSVFELESGNENVDGQTDKNGQTNGRNYTNFERNLAMMVIYRPAKFEFNWTNRFRVKSPETKMLTDSQTDIGHINLRGGLVTCTPPKKGPEPGSSRDQLYICSHRSLWPPSE